MLKQLKIGICVIVKDENRYLKEWIDHNFSIGISQIHIFEDFGSSSHRAITEGYGDKVVLHDIREIYNPNFLEKIPKPKGRQITLFRWFAEKYRSEFDWVAFIDPDEYIITSSIFDLLDEFEDHAGVYIFWKNIGANGHVRRPIGKVVENYTEEAVIPLTCARYCCKSIVNMRLYEKFIDNHRVKDGVNTKGEHDGYTRVYDKAWINHYYTKSWQDWKERITKRGDLTEGVRKLEEFFEVNPNMKYLKERLIF